MTGAPGAPRSSAPRRIVFLGPPGAGKGTQASAIARARGVPHLSTGDLLRAAVAARSPLGQEAEGYMREGKLVPDELVLRLLEARLEEADARAGFVLDGFPRTIAQAEALSRITPIDVAVWFEIDPRLLVERLSGRRLCPTCQRVYHVVSRPPKRPETCDDDGTSLVRRPDDRPEAVAERLRVYDHATAPLLGLFRTRGVLRPVEANGTPEEVGARLDRLLGPSTRGGP